MFSLIPTPYKIAGVSVIAVIVALYIGYLNLTLANRATKIAVLNGEVTQLRGVNEENARLIQTLKADSEAAAKVVAEAEVRVVERVKTNTIVKREIVRVAAETPAQCPASPALLLVLDSLRAPAPGREGGAGIGQAPR